MNHSTQCSAIEKNIEPAWLAKAHTIFAWSHAYKLVIEYHLISIDICCILQGLGILFSYFFRVSRQVQYFVDLEMHISWQVQDFVDVEVQIDR